VKVKVNAGFLQVVSASGVELERVKNFIQMKEKIVKAGFLQVAVEKD
jgi:hypothetical protein